MKAHGSEKMISESLKEKMKDPKYTDKEWLKKIKDDGMLCRPHNEPIVKGISPAPGFLEVDKSIYDNDAFLEFVGIVKEKVHWG